MKLFQHISLYPSGFSVCTSLHLSRALSILTVFILTGCQIGNELQDLGDPIPVSNQLSGNSRIISDIGNLDLSELTITTELPSVLAIVNTDGKRANIRSGPGLDFDIVGKAEPETTFDVVATNLERDWWQICCIPNGNEEEEVMRIAWLSEQVVRIEGPSEEVPVSQTILVDDVEAEWKVEWECGSERCEITQCAATVDASVGSITNQQWLQIDHQVTWDETCFSTDEWIFEVDRFTGVERNAEGDGNFLYSYWMGTEPGGANSLFLMDDGRQVAAWCSGPHEVEIEEGGGWTTIYTGNTCHDVQTGLLLLLSYEKRWLFSGEFEGNNYEREYFGDFEALEQYLVSTNVGLLFVER